MSKKIVILGISADIGYKIAKLYLGSGFKIVGTFRNHNSNVEDLKNKKNIDCVKCDLTDKNEYKCLSHRLLQSNFFWTHFFSSVGTSTPIGRFFDLSFSDWNESIDINLLCQLKTLHDIFPWRDQTKETTINFMAGGGTNSSFDNYSAYTVAKIALIKFCELIDSEYENLKIQILGPGFVRTKTHLETLNAGRAAGKNYKRVKEFVKSGEQGTDFEDIFSVLNWIDAKEKSVVSGRNFSVAHDQFSQELSF